MTILSPIENRTLQRGGILDDIVARVEDVEVGSGELYMFSDGLTEFAYGEDEMLGVAGLIQMVEVSTFVSS